MIRPRGCHLSGVCNYETILCWITESAASVKAVADTFSLLENSAISESLVISELYQRDGHRSTAASVSLQELHQMHKSVSVNTCLASI